MNWLISIESVFKFTYVFRDHGFKLFSDYLNYEHADQFSYKNIENFFNITNIAIVAVHFVHPMYKELHEYTKLHESVILSLGVIYIYPLANHL